MLTYIKPNQDDLCPVILDENNNTYEIEVIDQTGYIHKLEIYAPNPATALKRATDKVRTILDLKDITNV